MKIYFITGYSKSSGKPKYSKAYIQQYLLGGVIEAKTEDEKIIYLYNNEYYIPKK